jgi:hypothetical protein
MDNNPVDPSREYGKSPTGKANIRESPSLPT